MSYLIAVLGDRIQAELAYTTLEAQGLTSPQVTILGQGYRSADEFGLLDPQQEAKKRALFMSYWLVPFGFIAGYGFNQITGLDTLDWAGDPGNHILGGLLGAVGGAMGSYFVGGGVGLSFGGGGDAQAYRNYLKAGKYLVIVRGGAALRAKATDLLRPLKPEKLQGYTPPEGEYA